MQVVCLIYMKQFVAQACYRQVTCVKVLPCKSAFIQPHLLRRFAQNLLHNRFCYNLSCGQIMSY